MIPAGLLREACMLLYDIVRVTSGPAGFGRSVCEGIIL